MTAVKDVADTALRFLARRDWSGIEAVAVHGPEHITWNQAAAVIERTIRRPVQYREALEMDYLATLSENGASAEYARSAVEMLSTLAEGVKDVDTSDLRTSTPFTAWAVSELLSAVEVFTSQLETGAARSPEFTPMIQSGNQKHTSYYYGYEADKSRLTNTTN